MKWVWVLFVAGYSLIGAQNTNELGLLREQLKKQTELSRQLEEKLVQVTKALSDAQLRLEEQSTLLAAYQKSTNQAGVTVSQIDPAWAVSPVLLSASKAPLGTNLTFQSVFGRKVTFRDSEGRLRTFDVDDLHGDALAYYRIDSSMAKQRDAQIAAQKQRALAQYYTAVAASRDAWRNYNDAIARTAQERARAEQEAQQAQVQEQMRILAEQNEQLRANAALQAANRVLPVDEEGNPILPE